MVAFHRVPALQEEPPATFATVIGFHFKMCLNIDEPLQVIEQTLT